MVVTVIVFDVAGVKMKKYGNAIYRDVDLVFCDILQTEVFTYVLVFAIYLICRELCDFICLRATQGGTINKKIR